MEPTFEELKAAAISHLEKIGAPVEIVIDAVSSMGYIKEDDIIILEMLRDLPKMTCIELIEVGVVGGEMPNPLRERLEAAYNAALTHLRNINAATQIADDCYVSAFLFAKDSDAVESFTENMEMILQMDLDDVLDFYAQ